MSRTRFMSLPFHRSPAPRAGRLSAPRVGGPPLPMPPAARPLPPVPASRPFGQRLEAGRSPRERTTSAVPPFIALSVTPEPGQGPGLAQAVLDRTCRPEPAAGTVILDLRSAAEFDLCVCAALCAVRDELSRRGATLLVVTATRQARDQLASLGPPRLGAGPIHVSLRSAVLSAYAALPGPGVVTADIRAALARPAEPLWPSPAPAADVSRTVSASPAEDGAAPAGGWWTECSPSSTA